jgi:hypothetical protein
MKNNSCALHQYLPNYETTGRYRTVTSFLKNSVWEIYNEGIQKNAMFVRFYIYGTIQFY